MCVKSQSDTCNIDRATNNFWQVTLKRGYFSSSTNLFKCNIQILPLGPSTDLLMTIVCLHAHG